MFKTNESTEIERSYHRLLDSHLSKPFPSLIYLPCTALFIPNTWVFFFQYWSTSHCTVHSNRCLQSFVNAITESVYLPKWKKYKIKKNTFCLRREGWKVNTSFLTFLLCLPSEKTQKTQSATKHQVRRGF